MTNIPTKEEQMRISFDSMDIVLSTSLLGSFLTDEWTPTIMLFMVYTIAIIYHAE